MMASKAVQKKNVPSVPTEEANTDVKGLPSATTRESARGFKAESKGQTPDLQDSKAVSEGCKTVEGNVKPAAKQTRAVTRGRKAMKLEHTEDGHEEDQVPAERSLFDVLPDDVVLQVLSLLSEATVLRARLVCRRLRDLASHPDVWRHRKHTIDERQWPTLAKAVKRIAPHWRITNSPDSDSDSNSGSDSDFDFISIMPNVYMLNLKISEPRALHSALNRPRVITMSIDIMRWFRDKQLVDLVPDELAWAFTQSLEIDTLRTGFKLPSAVVDFLLRSHAPTLQELRFENALSAAAVAALAGAPRLRELCCPFFPELAGLLSGGVPPRLQKLNLSNLGTGPGAAAFVGGVALHLQRLVLADDDIGRINPVLDAVAASGQSALRELTVHPRLGPKPKHASRYPACHTVRGDKTMRRQEDMVSLALALPSLRHLTSLTVCFPPRDEFYDALTAQSVPHLKSLAVDLYFQQCAHAWFHRLLGLMECLPELRVVAGKAGRCGDGKRCARNAPQPTERPCPHCRRGCHEAKLLSGSDARMAHQEQTCFDRYPRECVAWSTPGEK